MKELKGKVAVITCAARGIGRALAVQGAREGMRLLLADSDGPALSRYASDLASMEGTVTEIEIEASRCCRVEELARQAVERFGSVDLLFTNAGRATGNSELQNSENDCHWVLGVEISDSHHALRLFVPVALSAETEACILHTGSLYSLLPPAEIEALFQTSALAVREVQGRPRYGGHRGRGAGRTTGSLSGSDDRRIRERDDRRGGRTWETLQPLPKLISQRLLPEDFAARVFEAVREGQLFIAESAAGNLLRYERGSGNASNPHCHIVSTTDHEARWLLRARGTKVHLTVKKFGCG